MTFYPHYKMSMAGYLADPAPEPSLSSGVAKILANGYPSHAWILHPRLNPHYIPAQKEAFDLGSAAHDLLLLGEDRLVVVDHDDWRTKDARQQRDEAREQGLYPVLNKDVANVRAMASCARNVMKANADLSACAMDPELTQVWSEGDTFFRVRHDLLSTDHRVTCNYKTTSSLGLRTFQRQIESLGYDIACALYLRGLPEGAKHLWLVQETSAPYECLVVGASPALVELGRMKLERAIMLWKQCMASKVWPGPTTRTQWVDPLPWSMAQEEEEQASQFMGLAL